MPLPRNSMNSPQVQGRWRHSERARATSAEDHLRRNPKSGAISGVLAEFVVLLPAAAATFRQLVQADPAERIGWHQELQELERRSDRMFTDVLTRVADGSVSPLERDDLLRLVDSLDKVIEHLELAGALVVGFELHEIHQGILDGADKLVAMSETAVDIVTVLKEPKQVGRRQFDFYRDESNMESAYRSMLFEALAPDVSNPINAMQETTLIAAVESATSALEKFVQALGAIAVRGN